MFFAWFDRFLSWSATFMEFTKIPVARARGPPFGSLADQIQNEGVIKMKTAVLAIDATRDTLASIEYLSRGLIRFQNAGLFDQVHVASVIHPDSYLLPYSLYRKEKYQIARQAKHEVRQKLHPDLKISSSEVLVTESQNMNDHVALLDRFAHSREADVIIVGTNDRSALVYLMQGSFAEQASLTSTLPVLVFSESSGFARVNRPPTLLVALSPDRAPSEHTRKRIVDLARSLEANISLAPMNDQTRWWPAALEIDRETAERIRREFAIQGTLAVSVLTNELVFAEQVPAIAAREQALLTIFCSTPGTTKKPMFAPSLNGRVIAEMMRPILMMKENTNDSRNENPGSHDDGDTDNQTSGLTEVR